MMRKTIKWYARGRQNVILHVLCHPGLHFLSLSMKCDALKGRLLAAGTVLDRCIIRHLIMQEQYCPLKHINSIDR
jgi:hypothetical protein